MHPFYSSEIQPLWSEKAQSEKTGTNLDLLVLYQALNFEISFYFSMMFFFSHFIQGFLLTLWDIWWKDALLGM